MTLTAGATLGPYRILEQIGRGGMATVYKAYQASLARNVAIKVLPAFFAEDPGFRERFQQEAIAIAKLRHPNILAVFDYGEEAGVTYIVSEFVDGGTLAEQIGTPLPTDYTARILGPIASAIDYAHARGVLHRDIKPSNILLARDGNPILSDFGLAKMVGSMPRLTQTGTTVGTPEYMAPEQAMGESLGPSSDLYSLAVVAYEMLTGRVPFTAETPLAVLLAHAHKPLPLPRSVNPALGPEVEAVLLKGLAKPPGDRYPTATELVHGLQEAARGVAPALGTMAAPAPLPGAAAATIAVPQAIPGGRFIRIPPLGPRLLIGGAVAFALLAGAVLWQTLRSSEDSVERPGPDATARVASPTGTDEAAAAPTGSATAGPTATSGPQALIAVKGDLIAEPELDKDETALEFSGGYPSEDAANVLARDGELELVVKDRGGSATASFIDEHPETYVAELDLHFVSGARIVLTWQLYAGGPREDFATIQVNASSEEVYMAFVVFSGATGRESQLGRTVSVKGLRSGRPVTIGIAVTGTKYVLYVDGQQVADANETRTAQGSPTITADGRFGTGSVIVTGLRIYEYAGD